MASSSERFEPTPEGGALDAGMKGKDVDEYARLAHRLRDTMNQEGDASGDKRHAEVEGYANLARVNVRTYDRAVVFLHYEPRREASS